MRTWIKITGGDEEKGIKALEQLAVKTPKVCINNKLLEYAVPDYNIITSEWTLDYYSELEAVSLERCKNLISKSGEPTGEYDFYFEWLEEPDKEYLASLEKDIKKTLEPLGIKYTLVNK